MRRILLALCAAGIAAPAIAADPPYSPMHHWKGIGIAFRFGYEEHEEADGTWRVNAAVHTNGDALNIAMYRAADLARQAGYPYVQFLRGFGARSPGMGTAILWVRFSRDAAAPTECRARVKNGCYTADVAEVLRRLSGPDGRQPGVRLPDALDSHGHQVFYGSSFGIGFARPGMASSPLPVPVPVSIAGTISNSVPVPAVTATRATRPPELSAAERYAALLRAAQPY